MDKIAILIKLKKQELNDKRKNLSTYLDHVKKLDIVILKLDEELHSEQQIIKEINIISYAYNNYYVFNRQKKELIKNELLKYQKLIANIQSEIIEAFSELKKYEIVRKNHMLKEQQRLQKIEENNLNELALRGFNYN